MSKITKDFVYKSFPAENENLSFHVKRDVGKTESNAQRKSLTKSGEEIELKIISNLHQSPGPNLLWKFDNPLKISDICRYMDECGLPVVIKVVGGSSILKLDKNDKILSFNHGVETRRLCEEQDTGRCYTVCCERRSHSELHAEKSTDQSIIIDLWRKTARSNPTSGLQDESERGARNTKAEAVRRLREKKRGAKYYSRFLVAISLKNDLLSYTPFLLSEDMGLVFRMAVGIDDCSTEEWIEYCQTHHRTTKQASIRHLVQEIKYEKLYLDVLQDAGNNNNNTDVIPFYLDNYVIPNISCMTSKSDDSVVGQQRETGLSQHEQLQPRSTSSSNLHPLSPTATSAADRNSKYNQSKRHHPVMGTSAKQVLIASACSNNKVEGNMKVNETANDSSSLPSMYLNSKSDGIFNSSDRTTPQSTEDILAVNISPSTFNRSLSPSWTISSSVSAPSTRVYFTKAKNNNNFVLDEGYYTKSDVGVPF